MRLFNHQTRNRLSRLCLAAPRLGVGLVVWLQLVGGLAVAEEQAIYSIGEPSAEEQLYLELINRARANPTAEGLRLADLDIPSVLTEFEFWPVNLTTMRSEFAALSVQPPLVFNANLNDAAQGHADDMRAAGFQGHTSSSGVGLGPRVSNSGYSGWSSVGENVYSFGEGTAHGHAAFQVDWGQGSGGMINGRGHRISIHSATFKEIGIGITHGNNGQFGPEFVTQDFGLRPAFQTFVTGVAYFDLDENGFYDPGEGIGGVVVQVAGAAYYAITSASGGYAVPVDADGNHTVTFRLAGLADQIETVTTSGGASVKLDFVPLYSAPSLDGPTGVAVGTVNGFTLTGVAGALAHEAMVATVDATPAGEGAENGTGGLYVDITGGYSILQTAVRRSGSRAIHLAHSSTNSRQQTVALDRVFVPRAGANLRFYSRLRASDEGQWSKVELSTDGGTRWKIIWRQRGSFGSGEGNFSQKNVSLAAYEGEHIRLRFSYLITAGFLFIGTNSSFGWFIDDISLSNTDELLASDVVVLEGSVFDYLPTEVGTERLYVRGLTIDAYLPWSAGLDVSAGANDFASWAARNEVDRGLLPGALGDLLGDYDGDGLSQAYEYGLEPNGLDPTIGNLWVPEIVEVDGFWIFDYALDTSRADVAVEVVASSDLVSWFTEDEAGRPAGFEDLLVTSGPGGIETRRARVPASSAAAFMRLRVTVIEP